MTGKIININNVRTATDFLDSELSDSRAGFVNFTMKRNDVLIDVYVDIV